MKKNPGTQGNVKSKIDLEGVVMIFVSYQRLILCAFLYFVFFMFLKLNCSINYIIYINNWYVKYQQTFLKHLPETKVH